MPPMNRDEQLQDLIYSLRRLAEIAEADSARREKEHDELCRRMEKKHDDLCERLERQNVMSERLALLLAQIHDRPHLSADEIIGAARKVIDEVRQGLYLRAAGADPWPRSAPSPDEQLARTKPTDVVTFKEDGTIVAAPMTLKRVATIGKWVAAAAAAGAGAWVFIRAIWKAATGR